jgi:hypothetical protein
LLALLASAATARGDDLAEAPEPPLGATGQIILTSDTDLDLRRSSLTYSDDAGMPNDLVVWSFAAQIAVDRVMVPSLTLGVDLGIEGSEDADGGFERVVGGVRAGWLVKLDAAHHFFAWPRAGLGLGAFSQHAAGGASVDDTELRLDLSCPVVWNVVRHLVVGIGPFLSTDLAASTSEPDVGRRATILGVRAMIGGWFRGT